MERTNCSAASTVVETAVGTMLTLECVLGLMGNAVALWTFFYRLKVWKPYAVYLFNLVVADLLLATSLPSPALLAGIQPWCGSSLPDDSGFRPVSACGPSSAQS